MILTIEDINKIKTIAQDFDYLQDKIKGKIFANNDGEVELLSLINFALENNHTLEHVTSLSMQLKDLKGG